MSGNVYEWCYDGEKNPSKGKQTNPIGSVSADDRVMRGGSWLDNVDSCIVGFRNYWWYGITNDYVGFRLTYSQ